MKIKSHSDVGNIQAMKDAQIGATGEYKQCILEPQILENTTYTNNTLIDTRDPNEIEIIEDDILQYENRENNQMEEIE